MSKIVWNAEAGRLLDSNANRIAQAVKEYNEDLELAWIPPEVRGVETPPYAIIHRPKVGEEYVVFTIQENEMDSRVLARLYYNDRARQGDNGPLSKLESTEAAQQTLMRKQQKEEMMEAHEVAYSILKSKKNYYKHNGVVY
jgi:hypothetical protein